MREVLAVPAIRGFQLAGCVVGAGTAAAFMGAATLILARRFQSAGVHALAAARPLFEERDLVGLAARIAAPQITACQTLRSSLSVGNALWFFGLGLTALGAAAVVVGARAARQPDFWPTLMMGIL